MSTQVDSSSDQVQEGLTSKLNDIESKLDQIISLLTELKNYIES